ncbi:helix-turn-helix domain-containing protein [Salinispora tropica]|uniref:Transcriptional regulator, AraC family n=1 Tax=Salinispora tropica (strain ATCC BAA-916 / DSM 44818 / JCM 13857 / NBRC 105044 / CNB-440) TaxID=369723 RepID=A4X6Y1_SALTO|nr:AraC family transcriptional regulator [Salinispora tropica]ABP54631.1 transcriptional regulator, AraC family [Salinispora tropica CNB-440]
MDDAVERAIEYLWERYDRPLTLTEIADSAGLSRFYFARLFRNSTGITPGRFLAAIRIYHAKRLLLETPLRITDVSVLVGYSSLGSFSNCFTSSVGISPGRFRRLAPTGAPELSGLPPAHRAGSGAIAGTISLPAGHGNAQVYLGAFPTRIVQHRAVAAMVVDVPGGRPSCYHLPHVPDGTWFVHAVAVADGVGPEARRRTALIGMHPLVAVAADGVTSAAVRLRRRRATDPPVLLALPELTPLPAPATGGCPATTARQTQLARPSTLPRQPALTGLARTVP